MLVYIIHLLKIMPISDGLIHSIIDPLTIGLAIGGVKALAGGIQALTAGKKRPEPKYEIPKEVFQATDLARQMSQEGMAEPSRMMALQGAQQSALFGMRAAQDRRGGLASIGNIQAGLDRSALSVAAQDAAARQQNQLNYQRALLNQAGEQKLKFQTEHASWMNAEQRRRANIGAGLQNIMGGIDFAGSMAAMGALSGTGKIPTFGGTDLTTVGTGFNRIGLTPPVSSFVPHSMYKTSTIPMPGSQLSSASNVPQPSYGLTSDQMLSRSIFQSLIRR
jgi:hypothetical protein